MPIIRDRSAWNLRLEDIAQAPLLKRILLGDPGSFRIEQELNAHMRDAAGNLKRVDSATAKRQWEALRRTYQSLGLEVAVLEAHPSLADSCFTANPSMVLPLPQGNSEVWQSRMAHPSRRAESDLHTEFFENAGLKTRRFPETVPRFEGCGDGLLHPGRFLLHAGIGSRSALNAWEYLASQYPDLHIFTYALVDARFYHLDTALVPLTETLAMAVREAFDNQGWDLLHAAFERIFPIPLEEGLQFAGNAHCPDGVHVLLQSRNLKTEAWLREHGFRPLPLETGEFMKSGGSVFCLKQVY